MESKDFLLVSRDSAVKCLAGSVGVNTTSYGSIGIPVSSGVACLR